MKFFHLSLMTVFAIQLTTLTAAAQTLSIFGDMRPTMPSVFGQAKDPDVIFRGQSPDVGGVPLQASPGQPFAGDLMGQPYSAPMTTDIYPGNPGMSIPMTQDVTTWNAFSPPLTSDPFLQPNAGFQPSPYAPYSPYGAYPQAPAAQGLTTYGTGGARPYRYGWKNAVDVSWLPGGDVYPNGGGVNGSMDIFGVDYRLGYTTPFIPGWILNWTNEFGYRNWSGPSGVVGLPSDLFRFGVDLEMETPQVGPYSISLGLTPSYNTDFDGSGSDSFQLDGRGIFLMQLDQYWTLGLGAMYWDRVKGRVIPYAGLIYRDDYWEWQLMFPEARVSLFLGNETFWSKWLYVRGEYHIEAYGIQNTLGGVAENNEVEIEDYRILIGLNMESSMYSWFFEGGWVLNRTVNFDNAATPDFDLGSGFIGQIGLRY